MANYSLEDDQVVCCTDGCEEDYTVADKYIWVDAIITLLKCTVEVTAMWVPDNNDMYLQFVNNGDYTNDSMRGLQL